MVNNDQTKFLCPQYAGIGGSNTRFWDDVYIVVVPQPRDVNFGPGPGPEKIVPLGSISKLEKGYVEYNHPPRPYRPHQKPKGADSKYDPRRSQRINDNGSDKPWETMNKYLGPAFDRLKKAGIVRSDWEQGQFMNPSEQEKGVCISDSPDYVSPGEMADFRTLTFSGHHPAHVRPNGIRLGWGGWDVWYEWQLYGRLVKRELLEKTPKPQAAGVPLKLVSEDGKPSIANRYEGSSEALMHFFDLACDPGTQSIHGKLVEKSNLGQGKSAKGKPNSQGNSRLVVKPKGNDVGTSYRKW
ncbi:hypothetical protein PG994_013413 [Apiospora phragmitis]|uniref:Uncharacterized protein n=1 Tax=Apiospora phragmitis TaxID=2905665 RepID=A0ABR1T8K9_9PEZI